MGVSLGIFAFRALSDAGDMGQFMAEAGEAMGQPIDAEYWSGRWRVNAVGFVIIAAGAVLSGLSFIVGHRSAWAVLSVALAGNAVWLLAARMRGSREYAFEATLTQIVASVMLAVFCAWAWRSRRRATSKTA